MRTPLFIVALIIVSATSVRAADTLRLTLGEAVDIALQYNFDVRIAQQDSLLARNTGATSIVGYLPKLNVTGSTTSGQTDIRQNLADGRVISQNGASMSSLTGNATLAWTVFDGFKMFATADRVHALEQQGLARVRATMQTVMADVITTFNSVVAFQQFLTTVDSALVLADQRFQIAQQQYDVGASSGVELSQARIDLNSQHALAIQMQADMENASSALLTLLGRKPTALVIADTTRPPIQLPNIDDLDASIDTLNPDLISMQKSLEAASAHVSEANAAFMPQLGVSASYQYNQVNQSAGFLFKNQTAGWNVGAQLQWNIFNGMSDGLARERALIDVQRARVSVDALRNTLKGQINRTYRDYEATTKLYALEQESYIEAQRNASVAVAGLRVGTVDALQVRQSLLSLLEVGERVARREYERRLAATEILRLAGRIVH